MISKISASLLCLTLFTFTSCQRVSNNVQRGKHGGHLIISKSAGPKSFNRLLAFDDQTATITNCDHKLFDGRTRQDQSANTVRRI